VTPAENEAFVFIKLELSPEPYEEITQPGKTKVPSRQYTERFLDLGKLNFLMDVQF